jgi:hypothetical protein
LYTFALSAIYGITLYTLSDYSDIAFLDAIVDTKSATATVYPWQIRFSLFQIFLSIKKGFAVSEPSFA